MEKQTISKKEALDMLSKMHVSYSAPELMYLINHNEYNKVELLLIAGINPNCSFIDSQDYKHFPIQKAIHKEHIAIIELLLYHGLDLNHKLHQDQTALMVAAYHNKKEVVKFLLKKGVDIHAKDAAGLTAMHYAKLGLNKEMVTLLKEAGLEEID